MTDQYLAHHGVKGMKWGVRRYENKGGSYTKRGVGHFRNTEKKYDQADAQYKQVKSLYKKQKKNGFAVTPTGHKVTLSKDVVKQAKQERKNAKKDMEFNYKQIKKDYKADKGKELYRSGKTITGSAQNLQIAGAIASGTFMAARYLKEHGKDNYAKYAMYAGAGLSAVNAISWVKNNIEANQLRAYYAHKGEYRD